MSGAMGISTMMRPELLLTPKKKLSNGNLLIDFQLETGAGGNDECRRTGFQVLETDDS